MNIVEVESPYHRARPVGADIWAIVLHSTGSNSYGGTISWFQKNPNRVSAHYVVSRHGVITKMVDCSHRANHAGVSQLNGVKDVNDFSIGIEMQHVDGKQDWPAVQLASVAWLCRQLMKAYNIKMTNVVGHNAIDIPDGRKVDPLDFPWAKFRALVVGK